MHHLKKIVQRMREKVILRWHAATIGAWSTNDWCVWDLKVKWTFPSRKLNSFETCILLNRPPHLTAKWLLLWLTEMSQSAMNHLLLTGVASVVTVQCHNGMLHTIFNSHLNYIYKHKFKDFLHRDGNYGLCTKITGTQQWMEGSYFTEGE